MSDDLDRLATALGQALTGSGITVATAESCTGGMVAEAITRVPGSSDYFLGGVVAYHNRTKVSALGVSETLLRAHGAVSQSVAEAMAEGARARLGAHVALSVTGVAGPGGGSPDKPVGLVFVGSADASGSVSRRHHFTGDRHSVRYAAATTALRALVRAVEEFAGAGELPPAAGESRPSRPEPDGRERPSEPKETPMVEALFGPSGEVTPVAFRWHGRHHQVAQIGGRRMENTARVFTIMTPESRMFELTLDPATLEWQVRPVGPVPT